MLDKLVVARWDQSLARWMNQGNIAYSGIASGTVTSSDASAFGAFTIASTVALQNPLPLAGKVSIASNEPPPPARQEATVSISVLNQHLLCLSIISDRDQSVQCFITDMVGRKIKWFKESIRAGTNRMCVDISELAHGMYVLRMVGNSGFSSAFQFLK